MKTRNLIPGILTLTLTLALPARGDVPIPSDDFLRVQKFFKARVSARYMEDNCRPVDYAGWEHLPTQICEYTVKDKATGTTKTARVILLDAAPERLSRWVLTACETAKGTSDATCTDKLSERIIAQSGAQFPVAGIVFEDIIPKDGINEIYCFRNGVTVKVADVPHRGTLQPTPQEQEKCLHGSIAETLKYARIAGTTREQYIANGGKEKVDGNRWTEVTKKLYQKAFNSDANDLLIAWAKANL